MISTIVPICCIAGPEDKHLADAHFTATLQKVQQQPHWQNLDAELDRCWAAYSVAEEVTATVEDSWDQSDAGSSGSTAAPALGSLPGRDSVPDALWPSLAARHAAHSSSPSQQALLQDLAQVRTLHSTFVVLLLAVLLCP